MNDSIPNLKIERTGDGLILLEQDDNSGNFISLAIHPIHLRHLAERFGLVCARDPQAQKTIATLTRRLRLLRDRIDHLGDYLTNCSDCSHANLDYELTYITATAALADEFCAELDDAGTVADGVELPTVGRPAAAPDPTSALSSLI